MKDFLYAVGNAIVDQTPPVLIGAVLVALVVALATATLCQAVRKRVSSENPTPIAGLILAANLLSMVVVAGYFHRKENQMKAVFQPGDGGEFSRGRPHMGTRHEWAGHEAPPLEAWSETELNEHDLARKLIEKADADNDGQLSPRESARLLETIKPPLASPTPEVTHSEKDPLVRIATHARTSSTGRFARSPNRKAVVSVCTPGIAVSMLCIGRSRVGWSSRT